MSLLNKQQIDILYQYCECKSVRYYDVQTELVDHLADAIEKLHSEKSALNFRELLSCVDAQFSENEFALIVKNKSSLIRKKYWRLYKEELIQFFTIPKIFLLISLYLLLFLLQDYIPKDFLFIGFYLPPFLYNFIQFILWKKKLKTNFGRNIYDSKLPLMSLKMLKWFTERIIILTLPVLLFVSFLPQIHLSWANMIGIKPFLFTYPLFAVIYMSVINIQFRVCWQIRKQYSEAFS